LKKNKPKLAIIPAKPSIYTKNGRLSSKKIIENCC
jgi:hypothetical protein